MRGRDRFTRRSSARAAAADALALDRAAGADERPADATPAALARSASRAEARRRGEVTRLIGTDAPGAALSSALGAAILGAVAAYAASSAVWEAWAADVRRSDSRLTG